MKRKGAPDSPFPLLWLVRLERLLVETMVLDFVRYITAPSLL